MGYALIFNNKTFNEELNLSDRNNSECDVNRLRRIFQRLNFRLNTVMNPTLTVIRNNMQQLLTEDLDNARCLIVVVMSHGEEGDLVYASDQRYNVIEEILCSDVFKQFPNLSKILITQACKDFCKEASPRAVSNVKRIESTNVLCFDSTFEGFQALRLQDGSPFIQLLCEKLEKHAFDLEFEEVVGKVLEEFQGIISGVSSGPQYPVIQNIGFKNLILGQRIPSACGSAGNFVIDN